MQMKKQRQEKEKMNRYTFAGAGYLKRMEELGLYTTDINEINNRIKKVNLDNIFWAKTCIDFNLKGLCTLV